MPPWPVAITEFLWQNALAAIPLVLIIAAICKCVPCRPSTRHLLWLLVLVLLLAPRIAPPERLTRLVTAALTAGEANPQPSTRNVAARSNETAPKAHVVLTSPVWPVHDRRDDCQVVRTHPHPGDDPIGERVRGSCRFVAR